MADIYGPAIRCEMLRAKVFAGTHTPTVLGEPGQWLPLLIEALRLSTVGEVVQAQHLRAAAFEAAPSTPARLDDVDAEWIADADPRLGPVLEVVVEGQYFWTPISRVSAIRIEPPSDLRDQVWLPVHFTWENGGTVAGFIPTRYPGTTAQSDPALLLGRRTEWIGEGELAVPVGQRILITDQVDVALMDLRRLDLHPPSVAIVA